MARNTKTIDATVLWPQLDRIFCMLPTFAAVLHVNKTWHSVVLRIQADWSKTLELRGMHTSPRSNPTPRVCAKLLRLEIDHKCLTPVVVPVAREEEEEWGYEPTSPAYSPTSPAYSPA